MSKSNELPFWKPTTNIVMGEMAGDHHRNTGNAFHLGMPYHQLIAF
jgi:hypothetical protein